MIVLLSFLCALGFVAVHIASKYLTFLHVIPRSKLLSGMGGVSVAYIFIHILPELNAYQYELNSGDTSGLFMDNPVYFVAMIGLAVFYGLEKMGKVVRNTPSKAKKHPFPWLFWIHMFSFFTYNFLIGYLLIQEESNNVTELTLYFFALSLHFLSNDQGLRQDHQRMYDHYGRWLLAAAVLIGWTMGFIFSMGENIVTLLFSFLAGGIILNVLKEELPEEKESNFWAFAVGLIFYAALLSFI